VQTLVNTSISFRVSRKRKEMQANLPGSSGAHPYQGCALFFFAVWERSFFLLPVQKKEGKENDTREGKISVSSPPGTHPI
jgi:hypothetical protein